MKENRRFLGKKKEHPPLHEGLQGARHHKHNNMYEQAWWKSGWGIIVAAAVLVVIIFAAWWVFHGKITTLPKTQTGNPVATIPQDQLPAMFPADIPIEAGAPITSNFNAAAANGQFQATRAFQSVKSVAANFAIYDAFLSATTTTDGWKILSTVNLASDPNHASILARGDGGLLTVDIAVLPPQPFPASLVTITYITNPPSAPTATASSSAQK